MKVLIADDSLDFCRTIEDIVQSFGFETYSIQDPEEAMRYIERQSKNLCLLLLDIEFGPDKRLSGVDILEFSRRRYPAIPVVMISGKGSIETAVKTTKLGAVNFIEKSIISLDKIKEVLDSAVANLGAQGEAREILKFLESQGIIGKSQVLIELGDSVVRFGRTELNVLITGETGTGKKLVAQAVHAVSRRAKYPFVTVDIPNIPRELFQSELFGHNKGSFSGAHDTKKGLFHQAHKGTLFLDEIGDLSPELQSNLFIPIEEKLVRRVGSVMTEDLDIRFISATDKDLLWAMRESKFREQLYHRLRECEIHIPPLRERKEDIPAISDYYLKIHNDEFGEAKFFSPSAVEYLQEQPWRGNVRELASTIRVALQTCPKDQIEVSDINKLLPQSEQTTIEPGTVQIISADKTLKEDLAEMDKKKIEDTLRRTSGNVSKSAAILGVSRETLHNKIRRYNVEVQLFRANKK